MSRLRQDEIRWAKRMPFSGMIYGLRLSLSCPRCDENLPLDYAWDGKLDLAILRTAQMHSSAGPCDPQFHWLPEQLGYVKGQPT